jgi:hypothetical protein
MPISVFMRFQSSRDPLMLYNAVISEMGVRAGATPPGWIYHIAGAVPHGLLIASTWETREAWMEFTRNKTIPLTEKRGVLAPEVQVGNVHNIVDGGIPAKRGTMVVATFCGNVERLMRQYDEASEKVGLMKAPPLGLVYHWASDCRTSFNIVDHWRSREEFERLYDSLLLETLRSVGMPQPRIEYYDVCNSIEGPRVHA